jgi:hypothetical protein
MYIEVQNYYLEALHIYQNVLINYDMMQFFFTIFSFAMMRNYYNFIFILNVMNLKEFNCH